MTIMSCGCTASGHLHVPGRPPQIYCGLHDCTDVATSAPDLTGRTARCGYHPDDQPSSTDLPFFRYRPDEAQDTYYCGCRGWN